MIGIGEMDSVVTVTKYIVTQNNSTGRIEKSINNTVEKWAKVEQLSESRALINSGISYTQAYKITALYEVGASTETTSTITLPTGEVLAISGVVKKDIGRLWVEEITAYTNE